VLVATYNYVPFYVGMENGDGLEGAVPFMLVRSRMTGTRLISLPFTSYCTSLMPGSALEEVVRFALQNNPRIDFLELKQLEQVADAEAFLEQKTAYTTHILNLEAGPDQLLKSFHSTSVRQRIRRAERDRLTVRLAENERDLKAFYRLHILSRQKHGLPPHPYAFFANMWHTLRPRHFLLVPMVEREGKVIGAAIVLKFRDTFHFEYSAADQESLSSSPNQVLTWETIKIACNEGAKYFDFGRSSSAHLTLIEAKERWMARRQDLNYYYFPKGNGTLSESENCVKRQLLVRINRLLPSRLLELEGKFLYPHLG
jgi:CelD/BcsL family acetyltransferase involved in cellulose biosynthesis